ncbi:MAG: AMP-binding protein, partial [Alphaproteobacteria bacterium]
MADGILISGDREITMDRLMENGRRAASGFHDLGIGEGDTVAIFLRNDFAFFEATYAATTLGAYAVPINWHLKADEAGYIIRDCAARALVIHADLLPTVAAAIPDDVTVLVVSTPPEIAAPYKVEPPATTAPPDKTDWDQWLSAQPIWQEAAKADRPSMIYTSGTTGMPKGVRRDPWSPETAIRRDENINLWFGLNAEGPPRAVITGPMYHVVPNHYGLISVMYGGFVVLQPRFDAEELLAIIERHRITHIHLVPTMFVRLLRLPDDMRARYDVSSLKFVSHGAAPCPPDVKRRMIEWFGPVIHEYYGATESGAVCCHGSEEALRKPGTVGRAIEGGTIRIFDKDGNVLPTGEIGEIYLRLDDWPDFTYQNLDHKRREIERDGLITIGDVGYLDEDGYL